MDRSARERSSRAGMVLVNRKGHKLNFAVQFGFKAINNVAKYKLLLVSLMLAKKMQVGKLLVNSDSQLIIS